MKAIAFALASLLVSSAALAVDPNATLDGIQGVVMVSKDKKFATVQNGQALKAGDRVLVLQDGGATIRFNDGCELSLPESSLAVVPEVSTCAGGNAEIAQLSPESAQALGLGQIALSSTGLWVVGGLPAAGVAAGESDDSVSP